MFDYLGSDKGYLLKRYCAVSTTQGFYGQVSRRRDEYIIKGLSYSNTIRARTWKW